MPAPVAPLPVHASRAHVLKNCLSIVIAVNKLVERELSETSRQRMARSHEALGRILRLLEADLVLDDCAASSSFSLVQGEDVVRAVLNRVADIAEAADVELFVQAGPGGVLGDAVNLVEALGNVVLNAIQSTPAGGAVFIATHERSDRSQLWVVQDTGRGMSGEDLARLQTPFFSRRCGGSGLGLASTREVIDRHGGLVHLESKPGSGTIVSIWLPASVDNQYGRTY